MIALSYVNEKEKVFKNDYRVHVNQFDTDGILVNADSIADALEYTADYCKNLGWIGMFYSDMEIEEMTDDELEDNVYFADVGAFCYKDTRIIELSC